MALVPAAVTTAVVILITCQRVNGIVMSCGSDGVLVYRELTKVSPSCSSLSQNTSVSWSLITLSGQQVALGTCVNDTSCTSQHQAVTTLSRTSISFNATRNMAGTLVCSEVFSNGTIVSANCTQDIAYPLQVDKVSVTINLENWTFTAEVVTSRVFSSLNRYRLSVSEVNMGNYQQYNAGPIEITSKPSFELYTNTSTGLQYHRGTVTASWSLPGRSGYYYYNSAFDPILLHFRLYPEESGFLKILEPSPPKTNCSLAYVPEVSPVDCMCSTMSLGSPAGRLQWLAGNDVIVSGGYGVTQLQFPTNSINRKHDGMRVTCQLDWVVKQSVFVTDNVAYGPERVSLQVHSTNCLVIATCTVEDVRPFSFDMIQWGGQCRGQRGVVCTFESCDAEDDEKEVTCSVTNHANNGRNVSAVENVTVTDRAAVGDTVSKSVGASVGATLGVLVLAVCLALGVVWIRRRYSAAGRKEPTNIRNQNSTEQDYAGLFEITGREITQNYSSNNESNPGSLGNVCAGDPWIRHHCLCFSIAFCVFATCFIFAGHFLATLPSAPSCLILHLCISCVEFRFRFFPCNRSNKTGSCVAPQDNKAPNRKGWTEMCDSLVSSHLLARSAV